MELDKQKSTIEKKESIKKYEKILTDTPETLALASFIKTHNIRKNMRDVGRELRVCGYPIPENLKEMLSFLRGDNAISKAKKKANYIAKYNKKSNNGVRIITDPKIKAVCQFWANALFY